MRTTAFYIMASILGALFFTTSAQASSTQTPNCYQQIQKRSPEEVLQSHVTALLSGDLDRIACDYDENAVIITPSGVISGHDHIKDYYFSIFQLMGGPGNLTAVSITTSGKALLLEWMLDSPHFVVGDGTDTFVVEKGLITYQTVKLSGVLVR